MGPKGEGRAFYVNGLLTPDIYMVRGQKYTFMIETGAGDGEMDNFHPVYITADPTGGGHQLKPELQAKLEKIYGGTGLGKKSSCIRRSKAESTNVVSCSLSQIGTGFQCLQPSGDSVCGGTTGRLQHLPLIQTFRRV